MKIENLETANNIATEIKNLKEEIEGFKITIKDIESKNYAVSLQLNINLDSGHGCCTEIPTEAHTFIIEAINKIIEFNNKQINELNTKFDNL
jgi:uncharacterized coiled-coil DUF342 family protein